MACPFPATSFPEEAAPRGRATPPATAPGARAPAGAPAHREPEAVAEGRGDHQPRARARRGLDDAARRSRRCSTCHGVPPGAGARRAQRRSAAASGRRELGLAGRAEGGRAAGCCTSATSARSRRRCARPPSVRRAAEAMQASVTAAGYRARWATSCSAMIRGRRRAAGRHGPGRELRPGGGLRRRRHQYRAAQGRRRAHHAGDRPRRRRDGARAAALPAAHGLPRVSAVRRRRRRDAS